MKTGNIWRLAIGVIFVVSVAGLLGAFAGALFRTEVSVGEVKRGTAVQAVPGVVKIEPGRTVEVRSEAGGKVFENALEIGGRVAVGDVILRIDATEVLRSIDRVRGELEAEEFISEIGSLLRYDIEEAREDLARKEELLERGRYSLRDLEFQRRRLARLEDEAKLEDVRAARRLHGLRNELERLENELDKVTIRAPVNGYVVEIFAHVDDVVAPRTPLARLLCDGRVITATLSEENFSGVKIGQQARVRFLSYGSRLFDAEVKKVLPAADPETQRYTVHLNVDMPHEMMTPGLTGEVSIILAEREGALVIPRRALIGGEVYVVRDGRVAITSVEPGFVSLNNVEILKGLNEGDLVAVERLDRLRDGDRVRIKK